jgi:hypothetical protein
MGQTASRILLAVFLFSVSIIPSIEAGHDLLHTFQNPFHDHVIRHSAGFRHSSSDHGFFGRKMKFAHEMDEANTAPNLVWFAYSFFTEIENTACRQAGNLSTGVTPSFTVNYLVTLLPPVPPPQRVWR